MKSTDQTMEEIARHGLGSTPVEGGVVFRVWAPHAEAVSVIGSWNEWNEDADPCEAAADGVWQVLVTEAKAGDEYRYALRNGERKLSKIDPRAMEVTNSIGNGVIRGDEFDWEGDDFTPPPHDEMVIYELHAPTFAGRDFAGAVFEGVTAKLGHLQKLGINAIEIMPVAEFAGDLSWGYNPAHIFAVESSYGGPDALKTLVRAAHRHGIAVILDVVYNHFGPSDLDLWQFDGWSENDKGGIYFYNDWRSETPWGENRPDYGRNEVRQFIFDNAMSWLRNYRMDGLRYDATLYIRTVKGDREPDTDLPDGWSLAQWVNAEIRADFPGRILIAEDLQNDAAITRMPQDGGAGFHTQWDAAFVHPLRQALATPEDRARSMAAVRDALSARYNGDAFQRVIYTESHDEVANGKTRVPQEIDAADPTGYHARKRSCLGAALALTAPGIPMIFQGQEFLQDGWFEDDAPLDWRRGGEFKGIVRMYRDLIHLRRNTGGSTRGLCGQGLLVHHLNEAENVIVFQRWDAHGGGDDVMIACNFSDTTKSGYRIGMPDGGLWKLRFNSDATVYDGEFQNTPSADIQAGGDGMDGLPASGEILIGPYAILIYSQDA